MRKTLLVLLVILCGLLLTGCYTENDPWPEASLNASPESNPTVTMVPATDVPPTAVPLTPQPAPQETLPPDAVDVSPNLNG